MSEREGPIIFTSREARIRGVVSQLKAEGVVQPELRDQVIAQVATPSLSQEPETVRQDAVRKYWEVLPGLSSLPVLLLAPHFQRAGQGEQVGLLRKKFPERSVPELISLTENWLTAQPGSKPHKTLAEDAPDWPVYKQISLLRKKVDTHTDKIARKASQGQITVLLAKKSRMWADANRHPFFHKKRGVGKEQRFVQTQEYPTSIRASCRFALAQQVKRTVGLDEEGRAKSPFLQVVVHGARDKKCNGISCDVVVGGGFTSMNEEDPEKQLASEAVLTWFSASLAQKMHQLGLTVGDKTIPVFIDRNQEEVEVFWPGQGQAVKEVVNLPQTIGLSGGGLGLEYFRTGNTFTQSIVDEGEIPQQLPQLEFPGFGPNFHTIQLEISNSIRNDEEKRELLAQALNEVVLEFGQRDF